MRSHSGSHARLHGGVAAVLSIGLITLIGSAGTACTGEPPPPPQPEGWVLPVDKALFDATWPLQVTDDKVRAPFEEPDIIALTYLRDMRKAVRESGGEPDLFTARAHADTAALYRQGALAAATAYVEYFDEPLGQAYDPVEKSHVLLVGKTLLGDDAGAKAQIDAVKALPEDSPVQVWAAPWLAMHDGGSWPADFSGLPFQPPAVEPGQWPEIGEARPSYRLPEQDPGTNELSIDDPVLLVQLALWHDAAAKQAAGDKAGLMDLYGARYRLPVEGAVAARDELPLELYFGSDFLSPHDAAFMAAVTGTDGLSAVDAYKDKAFLAATVVAVRGENGKISAEKAVDLVSEYRKTWKRLQAEQRGSDHQTHRIFADVAVAGVYRSLAMIAEIEGDRETSGKLRIQAKDMGEEDAAAAPEGLLSLTAWDADNQYTMRGLEIIHQQARRAPSLEVVRTALDLLAIRVGRSLGGGGTPGM